MENLNKEASSVFLPRKSTRTFTIPKFKVTKSTSSVFPSYTNLELPYRAVCRQRYQRVMRDQQRQFIQELKMHEELQPQALSGVKLYREFCNPILKKVSTKDMIKLTLAEERRLEFLLKTDPKDL